MNYLESELADKITYHTDSSEWNYEWFKEEFYKLTSIQLNYYKEKQMKRRIHTLLDKKGIADFSTFLSLLKTNSKELDSFVDYITINVTEFFRTPEHWDYLEREIFPQYREASEGKIRIWCSACSSGEEPYSMAMCLADFFPLSSIEIIATDIDENILKKAERGRFDERAVMTLPEGYLERYFKKHNNCWEISEELKSCIEFRQLDLLKDTYPMECDMILCRNVLIYFTEEAKELIYTNFKQSLKPDGYLFTGDTEQIVYFKLYGFWKVKNFLYQSVQQVRTNRLVRG